MTDMDIQRWTPTRAARLRVRRAVPGDAAGVAEVHVASWQVGYAGLLPDDLLARLSVEERTRSWTTNLAASDGRCTLVALDDGDRVLGFASVGPDRDDDAAPGTGELWALYAHPDSWRRGVGSSLMGAATDELVTRGFDRATLWVLTSNDRARRFYERHGWRARDRHKTDWRDDVRLDEVQYELDLPRP